MGGHIRMWPPRQAEGSSAGFATQHKSVCPTHSEAKQTEMSEFGAENGFIAGPSKENGWPMPPKTPQLPEGFQQRIFKDKVGGGGQWQVW